MSHLVPPWTGILFSSSSAQQKGDTRKESQAISDVPTFFGSPFRSLWWVWWDVSGRWWHRGAKLLNSLQERRHPIRGIDLDRLKKGRRLPFEVHLLPLRFAFISSRFGVDDNPSDRSELFLFGHVRQCLRASEWDSKLKFNSERPKWDFSFGSDVSSFSSESNCALVVHSKKLITKANEKNVPFIAINYDRINIHKSWVNTEKRNFAFLTIQHAHSTCGIVKEGKLQIFQSALKPWRGRKEEGGGAFRRWLLFWRRHRKKLQLIDSIFLFFILRAFYDKYKCVHEWLNKFEVIWRISDKYDR